MDAGNIDAFVVAECTIVVYFTDNIRSHNGSDFH